MITISMMITMGMFISSATTSRLLLSQGWTRSDLLTRPTMLSCFAGLGSVASLQQVGKMVTMRTPKYHPIHARAAGLITRRYLSNTDRSPNGDEAKNDDGVATSSSSTDEKINHLSASSSWEAYENPNNRRDQVFSAISGCGGIKVTAATTRNLLNEVMMMQTLTEISTEALGRTLICALLMANGIQDEQIVQITMNCDGPIRGIVAMATGTGQVRGYVGTPMLGSDGTTTLTEAVGRGSVQVVKNHPDWPRPYNGITSIRHGDIDRDIGIYLAESEQRSCALAAATSTSGVLCKAAGGYLIEQLPDVSKETVAQVEQNLAKLVALDGGDKLPANLLLQGMTPLQMAEIVLEGLDMQPLQQLTPSLYCECSEERLFRSVRLLPPDEVEEILQEQQQVEARCQFCGRVYRIGATDLRERLAQATGDPSRDE